MFFKDLLRFRSVWLGFALLYHHSITVDRFPPLCYDEENQMNGRLYTMKKNTALPFAMCFLDLTSNEERGCADFELSTNYDPKSQTSNTVTMGPTLVLSSFQERDSDSKADSED